jgi:hypothetical protein
VFNNIPELWELMSKLVRDEQPREASTNRKDSDLARRVRVVWIHAFGQVLVLFAINAIRGLIHKRSHCSVLVVHQAQDLLQDDGNSITNY